MKVLVLTLSFGSGHVQAARTVAHEVKRRAPGAEVRLLDALSVCRRLFRVGYVWPYWMMLRYAPALWDRFFTRRVAKMDEHTAPEWAFRWGCRQVFETIAKLNPDVIVAAEVAACEMAAMARRDGLTRARILCVITDYEAEPVWVKPEVDIYAVADERVGEQLRAWGAPASSVVTCGIPIAEAFCEQHDEEATRARYQLGPDGPIVLLMGGGMGPTRMDEVAARLCESLETMNIIAVTGHDERARRRLMRLRPQPPVSLRVLGWTEDVAALMRSASLLVTKPGGLTVAEAFVCAKPVVMFDPIPGPEQRNAERVREAGAGVLTSGASETASVVLSLVRDEKLRMKMSARSGALARPRAADVIAALVTGEPLSMPEALSERMTA